MKFLFLIIIFASSKCFAFTLVADGIEGYDEKSVTFDYNPTNCPVDIVPHLRAAVNLWNSVETARLKLKVGAAVGTTPAQATSIVFDNFVVVCDPAFAGGTGLAASGAPATLGNKIIYGYVVINANNATAAYFLNLNPTQRSVVLAHEMGHALGLGHTADSAALMYYDASSKEKLNLSQDDVDGFSYLYPRNEFEGDVLGCGTISNKNFPPNHNIQFFSLMALLPLLLALSLRFKQNKLLS